MTIEDEKKVTGDISVQEIHGLDSKREIEEDLLSDDEFTADEYRRLLRKVDLIIMVSG